LSSGENLPVQEIVIIRRKHDDHGDAHHGGMWKIAFADFMTAMMAFFLVMWLINATDENKLVQISNYFNPIKLPDQQKIEKTLQTADSSPAEKKETAKAPASKDTKADTADAKENEKEKPRKVQDEALSTDPYGILSKLATQAVKIPLPSTGGKNGGAQFAGGAAFRDPFDPDFRKPVGRNASEHPPAPAADDNPEPAAPDDAMPQPDDSGARSGGLAVADNAGKEAATGKAAQAGEAVNVASTDASQIGLRAPSQRGPAPDKAAPQDPKQLEAQIQQNLKQAGLQDLPDISVQRTAEGLLISLTDKLNFEMFGVSSVQPRPELVVAMERIGKMLHARPEKIVLRGHTDSRPYKSGTYDNWRLSTDRANIAHYMLIRGGLSESRFERIEGYADTSLRLPQDPKAAGNRRIEILLRQPVS
jgi:chemotaxis protein MotB